jgi:hypothetical protein
MSTERRYTLTITDSQKPEIPVMFAESDRFCVQHDDKGKINVFWGRETPPSFAQTVFTIEQKFAAGFDPGRVLTAVKEDAARLEKRKQQEEAKAYVQDHIMLRLTPTGTFTIDEGACRVRKALIIKHCPEYTADEPTAFALASLGFRVVVLVRDMDALREVAKWTNKTADALRETPAGAIRSFSRNGTQIGFLNGGLLDVVSIGERHVGARWDVLFDLTGLDLDLPRQPASSSEQDTRKLRAEKIAEMRRLAEGIIIRESCLSPAHQLAKLLLDDLDGK